jgi:hypothetical protein
MTMSFVMRSVMRRVVQWHFHVFGQHCHGNARCKLPDTSCIIALSSVYIGADEMKLDVMWMSK